MSTSPDVCGTCGGPLRCARCEEQADALPRWIEVAGWYGTFAIVGAYASLTLGVLAEGALYHGLNLSGALGVGLVCWKRKTWQPFWLEAVWATVALIGLLALLA